MSSVWASGVWAPLGWPIITVYCLSLLLYFYSSGSFIFSQFAVGFNVILLHLSKFCRCCLLSCWWEVASVWEECCQCRVLVANCLGPRRPLLVTTLAPRLVTAFPLVLVVRTRVGPQVQHWAETVATITMDSKWILLIASLAGDGVLS